MKNKKFIAFIATLSIFFVSILGMVPNLEVLAQVDKINIEDIISKDEVNVENNIGNIDIPKDIINNDNYSDKMSPDDFEKIIIKKSISLSEVYIDELTYNTGVEFKITLEVKNWKIFDVAINVEDFIDTEKFEIINIGENGQLDNSIKWNDVLLKSFDDTSFTYKIRFKNPKDVKIGEYQINQIDKKGLISYMEFGSEVIQEFENITIKVKEDTVKPPQDSELNASKMATKNENDEGLYDISFDIGGSPEINDPKQADIVLMLDKSDSMRGVKFENVKKSAKNAVKSLLDINETKFDNLPVRIAIGSFSDYAITELDFTSNKLELYDSINKLELGLMTNTPAALQEVKNILDNRNRESETYVIFFSDGMPKVEHIDESITESDTNKVYQANFSQYSIPENATGTKKTKFYSIGMFQGNTIKEKPAKFMFGIQNATSNIENYKSKYFTNTSDKIGTIFDSIISEIKGSILDYLATDLKLVDEIAQEFEYVKGQIPIVTTKTENGEVIPFYDYTVDVEKINEVEKVIFKIPKLPLGGVKVTFKIKPTNEYFGTCDKDIEGSNGTVETNGSASLVTNEFPIIDFESPTVDIAYKKGTIKITKNIEGEALSSNDKFIIGFNGPSRYNVEINGSGETILDFYLKDDKTNISNNSNINLNYMLVGQYTVNELVPMNYSNDVKFEIKVNGRIIDGKIFTLDKDNTNIEIIVTNKVANKGFLNDRSDKSNIFSYK